MRPDLLDVGGAEHLLAGGEPARRGLLLAAEVRLEGCMPAVVSSTDGSYDGRHERRRRHARWSRSSKKDRKRSRISAAFIAPESRQPAAGIRARNLHSGESPATLPRGVRFSPANVCNAPPGGDLAQVASDDQPRCWPAELLVGEARERRAKQMATRERSVSTVSAVLFVDRRRGDGDPAPRRTARRPAPRGRPRARLRGRPPGAVRVRRLLRVAGERSRSCRFCCSGRCPRCRSSWPGR